MNEHLKKISDNYVSSQSNVNPISKIDAEIIDELTEIVILLGQSSVARILRTYKKDQDLDILTKFRELKDQLQRTRFVEDDERDDDKKTIDFVKIKDQYFVAEYLVKIRPVEKFASSGPIFQIALNEGPLPTKDQWYMDTFIDFRSKQDRDEEIDRLIDNLSQSTNVRFL